MARVFAYGSLVSPDGGAPRPATLPGWRRRWGVAMDNAVDIPGYKHFERPAVFVAFLDIDPADGHEVEGAVLEIADAALPALDARERNYARVRVETSAGPAWTYVGSRQGRARLARGVREGRCVVAHQYLDRVRAGFAALGDGAMDRFERSTGPLPGPVMRLVVVPHA